MGFSRLVYTWRHYRISSPSLGQVTHGARSWELAYRNYFGWHDLQVHFAMPSCLDDLHSWLSVYQLSGDMIERGIVEVIFGDRDDGSI
jgi:hypothetical protein